MLGTTADEPTVNDRPLSAGGTAGQSPAAGWRLPGSELRHRLHGKTVKA